MTSFGEEDRGLGPMNWGRVCGGVDHVPGSWCVVVDIEGKMYLVRRISRKKTTGLG